MNVTEQQMEQVSFKGLIHDLASFDDGPAAEPAWPEFFYYFRAGDALGQIALSDVYMPDCDKAAIEAKMLWKTVEEAVEDGHELAGMYALLREAIEQGRFLSVDKDLDPFEVQAFIAGINHAIREWTVSN
jgi:hypothetical protein